MLVLVRPRFYRRPVAWVLSASLALSLSVTPQLAGSAAGAITGAHNPDICKDSGWLVFPLNGHTYRVKTCLDHNTTRTRLYGEHWAWSNERAEWIDHSLRGYGCGTQAFHFNYANDNVFSAYAKAAGPMPTGCKSMEMWSWFEIKWADSVYGKNIFPCVSMWACVYHDD